MAEPRNGPRGGAAQRLTGRWLGLALAIGVIITTSGCSLLPTEKVAIGNVNIPLPKEPPQATVKVAQGDVVLSAQVAGSVRSKRVQNLYFHNGGRVATLAVQDGQHVAQGAVLASLDVGDLTFTIDNQNLSIERDQINLNSVKQQIQTAPPTDQDQADQQALQLQQAQIQLQQDQLNLEHSNQTLAQSEVIAPFAGVVNDVAISAGDNISGFQVVMDISDPTSQAFICNLDTTTAKELAVGNAFTLSMSGQKNQVYHGTIADITIPTADQIAAAEQSGNPNGIPTPQATLDVTDYSGTPVLGATFTATIDIQQAKNVLYLPQDAIRQFNGSSYVDISDNGVITEQPVVVGLQGDTTWEITSGVTLGEEVVEP